MVEVDKPTDDYNSKKHYSHGETSATTFYKSYFTVIVNNLPRRVNNFQLHRFFGQHGKVSQAKVRCQKKTNISKGFGHVTMEMVEEHANALATLDGLVSAYILWLN